jgi:transposase
VGKADPGLDTRSGEALVDQLQPTSLFLLLYGDDMPRIPVGFHVLPRRWGIERTFAGLVTNRRLAIDYEKLPETGETFIYRAMSDRVMSRILMKRLARSIHT